MGLEPPPPPNAGGGGVVERGSKGHKLISSMQISEIFGSNLLMGWVCVGGRGAGMYLND